MSFILIFLALIPFYLLGTFPTGYLLAKSQGVDIRQHGSGNIGATNVARIIGKRAGLITLVVDVFKGLLAVLCASLLSSNTLYVSFCAIAVVLGHCFSLPPKWKGGKGVATALGALLGLHPLSAVCALAVFSLIIGIWRIVSLASVSAALLAPVAALLSDAPDSTAFAIAVIALIIVFRHRSNLSRLAEGREAKLQLSE